MRRRAWLSFVAMGFLAATGQSQSTHSAAPKVAVILQGSSSFIVLVDDNGQQPRRLTTRPSGLEGEPTLSRDGKLIAYSLAQSPGGKSEVWIAPSTGGQGTRVSSPDQDALTPAFAQADRSLLYATSGFNGHYSPVARPRRHDFEVNQIPISLDGTAAAAPIVLTHQKFFDLRSLSVSDDGASFLISTTEYPIGGLFEEFDIASPDRIKKIFQPVVHGSPSIGVAYGKAAYVGLNIVFEAASEPRNGGNFDYNLYAMSGATGGNLIQLTHHQGLIQDLSIENGKVWMLDQGQWKSVKLPDAN